MVYNAYLQEGIINGNDQRIYLFPELLDKNAAVLYYKDSDSITSTVSVSIGKLPISKVFDVTEGVEFSLLSSQSKNYRVELLELFRYAFWYGFYNKKMDFYIGVHPHHVKFYKRVGFSPISPEMKYHSLNDKPVVIMYGDLASKIKNNTFEPILRGIWENPVSKEFFDGRLIISKETIAGSVVEKYLAKPDKKS
jgi:hypothetical protein